MSTPQNKLSPSSILPPVPKPSKSTNQRNHAKRRAAERFDLNLHQDAQAAIVRMIQNNQARFVRRQSLRVSVFEVEFEGQIMPVVYDRKRKTIATVLPEVALERKENVRSQ